MTLRRCTKSVDGTIPVQALLYNDEQLLASQDGLGIYEGAHKSPNHQLGTVHVTTHRLFFISVPKPRVNSFALDLDLVNQTDYYAGLFKSSAKVTLYLSIQLGTIQSSPEVEEPFASWECEVCGYRNPPGRSPAAARICGLCGVPRDSIPSSSSAPTLSTSLPSAISTSERPCPACTFLNHPALRTCEICGTGLPTPPSMSATQSAPSSRPASPDLDDDNDETARLIKLSFRKGGDKAFYAVLRRSLKSKAWVVENVARIVSSSASGEPSNTSGINGILRTVESTVEGRSANMNEAFQDLEALMIKAADMVRLAADLNEKLTIITNTTNPLASTSAEPEEATFIRSSLAQLGLQITDAPVTQDMVQDERRWLESLARELAIVLQGGGGKGKGLMRNRNVIALDEAWGGWNRARGVALLPPATLLQAIPFLAAATEPPIGSRSLPSGLCVLHTPSYAPAAFAARLVGYLALVGPRTTAEIAEEEELPVALAAELVEAVELDGEICRDDGACMLQGGNMDCRWWGNIFHVVVWDGQTEIQ
ncbi:GLUE N-terminal domain-containing protein [Mycena indigotica]|uniref:Vacuolar protein-sorting-associated protein 36 n=1 Tax=Mycena indigotica TaxID=2126181 RepID=A0A8H6SI65_9AGAR|nr:GLUE N-terminal domain-containing protein [Mycena indigotica]KAF7299302.1 GLUE N-terminal domain-containing protein [Mycena indigotica]